MEVSFKWEMFYLSKVMGMQLMQIELRDTDKGSSSTEWLAVPSCHQGLREQDEVKLIISKVTLKKYFLSNQGVVGECDPH